MPSMWRSRVASIRKVEMMEDNDSVDGMNEGSKPERRGPVRIEAAVAPVRR